MPLNSSELAVASGFYSSVMIGVIITTFDKSEASSLPTSDDLQLPIIFRTSDDVSF